LGGEGQQLKVSDLKNAEEHDFGARRYLLRKKLPPNKGLETDVHASFFGKSREKQGDHHLILGFFKCFRA